MSIKNLPAIMGTVLIVAGLALVGVSTWSRAEGSEKTTQCCIDPLRPPDLPGVSLTDVGVCEIIR